MRILNRTLTLTDVPQRQTVRCHAGCRVELNALETASLLNPFHPGFRLECVLLGIDVGPDTSIWNFGDRNFNDIAQIAGLNQTFEEEFSKVMLNEDVSGVDEIAVEFTLTDRSNNQRVIRRSNVVQRNFS
jgi:hypothetical protein